MIVSIHQPNFAPWLGFFDKMANSDILVLLDTVQLIRRGYQNRTLIKSDKGPKWLTIPVLKKGRLYQKTREAEVDDGTDWRTVHQRTLHHVLSKAPYREDLIDCIKPIYLRKDLHRLADFNITIIREIVDRLGIRTQLVMASELECKGSSSGLMVSLTKAVGGDVYLSGPTGRQYLEPAIFSAECVTLRYHAFQPFEYPQRFGPFIPGLSCFDYLANVGFRRWYGTRYHRCN
jgi:WbqC-like protein family